MSQADDPPPIPREHRLPETADHVSGAPEHQSEALSAWRRRSRKVQFYRRALPITIGVIAVALLGWILVNALISKATELKGGDEVRLVNPRFYGQDARGRAFVIGAREAVRVRSNEVRLEKPLVSLSNETGAATRLTADKGQYGESDRKVRLNRNVVVTDPKSGFVFRTGEALIDTRTGQVTGNAAVNGEGPLGRITASSYAIEGQGSRVILKGGVRARLEQERK